MLHVDHIERATRQTSANSQPEPSEKKIEASSETKRRLLAVSCYQVCSSSLYLGISKQVHENQKLRHIQRTKSKAYRPKAVARSAAACLQVRAAGRHTHDTATRIDAARRIDNLRINRDAHVEQTKERLWLLANEIKLAMAALAHLCVVIVRSHQIAARRCSQTKCLRQERRLQLAFKVAERSPEVRC